jgi:hypothetical protein
MITGKLPSDPEFLADRAAFLAQFGELLAHAALAEGEPEPGEDRPGDPDA